MPRTSEDVLPSKYRPFRDWLISELDGAGLRVPYIRRLRSGDPLPRLRNLPIRHLEAWSLFVGDGNLLFEGCQGEPLSRVQVYRAIKQGQQYAKPLLYQGFYVEPPMSARAQRYLRLLLEEGIDMEPLLEAAAQRLVPHRLHPVEKDGSL
jgi:hypothetical protein